VIVTALWKATMLSAGFRRCVGGVIHRGVPLFFGCGYAALGPEGEDDHDEYRDRHPSVAPECDRDQDYEYEYDYE